MAWFVLFVAGLFEIAWAVGLKYSAGFTRLGPSLATIAALAASFVLLAMALRSLPLGAAYAVWTGIGTVGSALLGAWLFGEALDPRRAFCIALIVAGITGLKLLAPTSS